MEKHLRDVLIAAGRIEVNGRLQSHWNSGRQHCAAEFFSVLIAELGFRGWNASQSTFHASELREIESKLQDSESDVALWCALVKEVKHNAAHSTCTVEVSHQFTVHVQNLPTGSSLEEHLVAMQRETLYQFNCSPCSAFHANASMKYSCYSPSAPLLMFQLQRYSWNEPKIAADVGIPEFLHFCERDWELIAVVCHIGTLPSNGHYVAHVKTNSGLWHCADDMEIEPEGFQAVRQSASQDGLLLLYHQRGIDLDPRQLLAPEDVTMIHSHSVDLDAAIPIYDTTEPTVDDQQPESADASQSVFPRSTWLKCAEVKAAQEYMRQNPDASVSKACEIAGVSPTTYYKYEYCSIFVMLL
jgi:hypothetical protein